MSKYVTVSDLNEIEKLIKTIKADIEKDINFMPFPSDFGVFINIEEATGMVRLSRITIFEAYKSDLVPVEAPTEKLND